MQKLVIWAAQVVVAIALAIGASLASGHGLSLLLAGMAGGAAIASGVGLGIRFPEDPLPARQPTVARVQRDGVTTSISTLEG
ncbi:MAG TPA: hypothetical protein VKO86_11550 [Gemmatimonadales bacterium]|nr:hypothetical protein [Gemmatimonadales bacterium]